MGAQRHPALDSPGALTPGLPSGHPIATTGFPKVRSAVERVNFSQEVARPRHAHLERRLPAAGHV